MWGDGVLSKHPYYMLVCLTGRHFSLKTQTKSFVSVVALKVERWAYPSSGFRKATVGKIDLSGTGVRTPIGYRWSIHPSKDSNDMVFTATVHETGGTPTGVPSSLRGMTIDPLALGKDSLPMTIVLEPKGTQFDSKLYGVFPHMSSEGIPKTIAFFSVDPTEVTPAYRTHSEGSSNLGKTTIP